ncbi:hypothetical protein [Planktothrix sp. FACHB-1365]|uniref:hypothetical protein n=1 Tax=Planktothrix sp. FACHB-1365 TaxID=2692855 RepID=UPI001682666F|nr:hypothetical protein [Planktothrix sp. FACHB-1365]MBD2484249.1 hypothetical protein [Planktothrix sp. FACHB-1365]
MNTYSIIMLGPTASGKTVFLASLYKKLSTQGDAGFFLEVDNGETGNRLHDLYSEIVFGEDWPKPTFPNEIPEWTFTCRVQTKNLPIYSACKFTYIDYAGGRITDYTEKENQEFYDRLQNADIMLGLLDGQRIISLMQHGKLGNIWAINELPKMLSLMQKFGKPIQFVISKWDIVEDKYSLQEVLDLLLSIDEFKNLVQTCQKAEVPIHLIPVSAVGKGFATLQPDGSMLKTPDVLPKPFQVELPLACVLPDLIQVEYNRLEKQKQEMKDNNPEVKENLNFFEQVGQIIGEGLKVVAGLVPDVVETFLPKKFNFPTESLQKMINLAAKLAQSSASQKQELAQRRSEELRREREQTLAQVTDEQTALTYALDCFLLLQTELYKNFPESKIELP